MKSRVLAILIVLGMVLASCGTTPGPDEADIRSTVADVAGPTTAETQPIVSSDIASGAGGTERADRRWAEFEANVETDGMVTQNGAGGEPELSVVASTSSGFIAAGTYAGALAVWRSDDLSVFTPVYNEVCCDRYVRPQSIAEIDGTLLIGGSGEVRGAEPFERTFLLRSDDGGESWSTVEHPAFERATVLSRILVVGGVVIVEQSNQSGGRPRTESVRSSDLVGWAPVSLPGSVAEDWPFFVDDGDTVFAISTRYDDGEGYSVNSAIWSSVDGGDTFVERPPLERLGGGGYVVVDESLVQFPATPSFDVGHAEPNGVLRLEPGGEWTEDVPDVGQWGDGETRVLLGDRDPAAGRWYSIAGRTTRASAHYCYEDDSTCHQAERALVSTIDGRAWSDVVGPEFGDSQAGRVMITAAGEIVIWVISQGGAGVEGFRWTANERPELVDPPGYASPSIPVPLYEHGNPFPVDSKARVVFGVGGCGGALQVAGARWEPDEFPDEIPDEWPYREVFQEDGVAGYLYGRMERASDDVIEFSIEGLGVVAVFRPSPPPGGFCG